jgi:putative DNA primase/helicase
MKTEIPPPDIRLEGKVTILPFPPQRDVSAVASVIPPEDAEPKLNAKEEIRRLAKLDTRDYELERKDAAKRLKVRPSALDGFVAAERNEDAGEHQQGHVITLSQPDPWPEPVDGAMLLDNIRASIRRHVVMSTHTADTAALWVLHTYTVNHFGVSPRLAITSPEKGCGKTTLLDVLSHLVSRAMLAANITAAATFRVLDLHQPTLLIDEADTFLKGNDELRGILNSGHRQNGSVIRLVGDDHEPRAFRTYSACAIAMIGNLPPTLADRSLLVELRRRRSDEKIQGFRFDRTAHLDKLASQAARWSLDHAHLIKDCDPDMPVGVDNRAADNWRPLMAIADVIGHGWDERSRRAALAAHVTDDSAPSMLLTDIRAIFCKRTVDRLSSADIIAALTGMEGRPWAEYKNGAPITAHGLAKLLSVYKIFSGNIRIEGATPKGYHLSQFQDAFDRYLPEQDQ